MALRVTDISSLSFVHPMEPDMTKFPLTNLRLWLLAVIATTTCVWAQEPGKPAVTSRFTQVEATVQAIDPTTREVTLLGPKGPVSFKASPDVKNLDKVHVGDKVKISYYQGIATQMAKGGKNIKSPETSVFTLPSTSGGERPGGGMGMSMTTTVTIEAIDLGDNTVTFKGADGLSRTIAVASPNMQQFVRTLKPGDHVQVTYTESMAVSITPATGSHVAEGK
jgi:hypothetical protein